MWDKQFGGNDGDFFSCIQQTADSGFILGGASFSGMSGNKSQPSWGGYDYWIVKTDSLGIMQWDKDFGGSADDNLYIIQQTADGGFILGGTSRSGISGDKTQTTWGTDDYWIVKTDSLGNKEWDKDFGGTDHDYLLSIQQTADGGFILGGYSESGISGDKTQANWDPSGLTEDYWIVKTDSLGNKQWDKDFGGTAADYLTTIQQTADGGFLLSGHSESGTSGDKTQPGWGMQDYWIIKTDSSGNKLWDKDFGGTNADWLNSMQQTSDGGFILAGSSASGISGDKTQPLWGGYDYWIIKTDSLGIKQWDKDFGGTDNEELWKVSQTADGGYLISGDSYSPLSGNKTENNLGQEQAWVVRTDLSGNLLWDKTVFTLGHDEQGLAIQSTDGCYVIGNWTEAWIGGYKTQPTWNGSFDYWFIKFCDTTSQPLAAFSAVNTICPGTCIGFTNLSANATSFQWYFPGGLPDTSTAVDPTGICYNIPGQYDVSLIAGNSGGTDTLTLADYITVFPLPPPQSILQYGDTLVSNTGFITYQWFYDGDTIWGATNYFYVATQSGDYSLLCSDGNGCIVEVVVLNVIAEVRPATDSGQEIVVYPNPASDELFVTGYPLMGAAIEVSIYNVLGEKIYTADHNEPLTLNCKHFPKGMYYLELVAGKSYRVKFVRQ